MADKKEGVKLTKRSWSVLVLNTLRRQYLKSHDKVYFILITKKIILNNI